MATLIATHEMVFARDVADFVAFLHEGTIVEYGTPQGSAGRTRASRDPALPQPPARRRPRLSLCRAPARRG